MGEKKTYDSVLFANHNVNKPPNQKSFRNEIVNILFSTEYHYNYPSNNHLACIISSIYWI